MVTHHHLAKLFKVHRAGAVLGRREVAEEVEVGAGIGRNRSRSMSRSNEAGSPDLIKFVDNSIKLLVTQGGQQLSWGQGVTSGASHVCLLVSFYIMY